MRPVSAAYGCGPVPAGCGRGAAAQHAASTPLQAGSARTSRAPRPDLTTGRFLWDLDESFTSADAIVQFFSVHTELGILPGRFTKIG